METCSADRVKVPLHRTDQRHLDETTSEMRCLRRRSAKSWQRKSLKSGCGSKIVLTGAWRSSQSWTPVIARWVDRVKSTRELAMLARRGTLRKHAHESTSITLGSHAKVVKDIILGSFTHLFTLGLFQSICLYSVCSLV